MFQMLFGDAKLWRSIVEALSSLVDEANFIATPEGIRMKAMDPSHIAMIDFEMPKAAIDDYRCSEEFQLGINLDEMTKIMRRGSSGDSLELTLNEKTNRLNARFKGKAIRTFSLALLDLQMEELPTPKIEFNAFAKVTTDVLRQAIDDAAIISDHIRMVSSNKELGLFASGDTGELEIKLNKKSDALLEMNVKEESKAMYALDYMSDIMKAASTTDIVELQYSTNMPIRLDFVLLNGGRIVYYLAPRIESE